MSQYFILLPDDSEKDCINDCNRLGESSFGTFYPETGLKILQKMINNHPEHLESVRIMNDKGNLMSVEDFLSEISKLRIYRN